MMKGGFGRLGDRLCFGIPPFLLFLPLPHGTNVPLRRKPLVTIALVWTNIAIFLGMLLSGRENFEAMIDQWGYVAVDHRMVTLFTYQFLHGGVLHLLGNMLFLWIFGANVEDRLGRLGFLLFYLASGVAAILFFIHVSGLELSAEPCAGASGSIYGVMGAFFVLFPLAEVRVTFVIMVLVLYWRVRTFWVAAFFIAPLFVVMNLLLNLIDVEGQVAFMAHVGGFLFAIPCGLLFRALFPVPKPAPVPEIRLEEDEPKPPQSEAEKRAHDLQEALYAHLRPQAIRLYEEGVAEHGTLPLAPVDVLALGEAMVWEERFHSAVEVYKQVAKDRKVDPALRTRAALEVGRLYIGPLGDIPRGVRVFRRALKRFPHAGPMEDIRRELSELEQRGYPLDWRTPDT